MHDIGCVIKVYEQGEHSLKFTNHHLYLLLLMLISMLTLPAYPLSAEEQSSDGIATTKAKLRFTYEDIRLPANETLGFLGGTFLYDTNDWLSVGAGTYGAMVGNRGGFITVGVATEVRQALSPSIEINSGAFVGAGGGRGGFALSGGGLMLRYHLGMKYKNKSLGNFGAGFSYLNFPDGSIHSSQPYLSYELPFRTLILSGWQSHDESEDYPVSRYMRSEQEIAPIFRTYFVPRGVLTDNGGIQHRQVNLAGIEWNHYLNHDFFLHLESLGALGGRSRGYMQSLMGGGYRIALSDGTHLKLAASAGMAGGGNVATGGGLLVHAETSLQQRLTNHLYAEVSGGYVKAPDGNFKAYTLTGKLGYHFYTPKVSSNKAFLSHADLRGFQPSHFRVRMTQQKYIKASPNWRTHHSNLNVDNLGIQMDAFVTDKFFLSGQALAAYSGKAGAYMVGLVGAGVHQQLFGTPIFFDAEALVGAAGGGGLSTGGGLVWQSNAGLGYQFNKNYSLIAQYGYMAAARQGHFKAKVATVSLGYNFTLFTK